MTRKAVSYYNWSLESKKKEKEEDKESKVNIGLNEDEFKKLLKKWKAENL